MYPNLRAEMARNRFTLAELAKEMGTNQSTLSLKMSGKRYFTLPEALLIKNLLGVDLSIEELFQREEG